MCEDGKIDDDIVTFDQAYNLPAFVTKISTD